MERRQYRVGEDRFWQGPLTCGQTEHFLKVLPMKTDLIQIDANSVQSIMKSLGASLYPAMAVCLVPDDMTMLQFLAHLDTPGWVEKQAAALRAEMNLQVASQVITDFFVFNPLSWLLAQVLESASSEGSILEA